MAATSASQAVEHVDVLIVGAGLSGIGCAYYLQKHHPQRRYVILEARPHPGGTWDLFRFPGIRSDSDRNLRFSRARDPLDAADSHDAADSTAGVGA